MENFMSDFYNLENISIDFSKFINIINIVTSNIMNTAYEKNVLITESKRDEKNLSIVSWKLCVCDYRMCR